MYVPLGRIASSKKTLLGVSFVNVLGILRFLVNFEKSCLNIRKVCYNVFSGSVAQLVEQRPEEPCVDGSSPPGTTTDFMTGF